MSYIVDHQQKFDGLNFQIKNQDQLKRQANGGNSILFSFQPNEEHLYINQAKQLYQEQAAFIDISHLLVKFIDSMGWNAFKAYYAEFQSTPHKIFQSNDPEDDLFDLIIGEIQSACDNDKIPFLIRTGCLYGTGIENANIMDYKTVRNLKHPLVIFYPSRIEDDNIYFLNFKPASKYRCVLVK
jgi:hypothetical protein